MRFLAAPLAVGPLGRFQLGEGLQQGLRLWQVPHAAKAQPEVQVAGRGHDGQAQHNLCAGWVGRWMGVGLGGVR